MCRNIKLLFNFDPPATEDEIRAASLQYVRKVSGFAKPSEVNKVEFEKAVEQITKDTRELFDALITSAPHKNREEEVEKARIRSEKRFGKG